MKLPRLRHWLSGIALLLFMAVAPQIDAQSPDGPQEAALWNAIARGGHVLLMRHALAPDTGDPAGFKLDDCASQRNLSPEGRRQAQAIGVRIRSRGVRKVQVHSSQWCRCLETARLLGFGEPRESPALNSFFDARDRKAAQTAQVLALIGQTPSGPSLILVTHQVNMTALTGVAPDSGEILVLRPEVDGSVLLGRLRSNDL